MKVQMLLNHRGTETQRMHRERHGLNFGSLGVFRFKRSFLSFLCVSVSLWLTCPPALAQAPELGGLLPSGGLRGQITRVRIDGKRLAGARLHVSGKGIVVKSVQVTPAGDSLTAEVTVEPGALLGPHEVRLVTSKGVSNGARFWVDIYPNRVLEQTLPESAAPIELDGKTPVVVNGRISAKAGRDRFALTASAGDTWTFDCFADRIRSRFDPVLELRDERGVSVRLVESTWENDPRFAHTFARAGRYTLTVRDSEYNGGPNYVYRLLAGRMPFISSYSPRGTHPGGQVEVAMNGTNLLAPRASVSIPADSPMGTYWAEVQATPNCGLLLPMMVEPEPVMNAADSDSMQTLPALPAAIDGVFGRGSRARFSFHGAAKSKYLFDLLGRRIGSRIDGDIRVLDAKGKELAANDDMNVLSKDARLEFAPPADGEYTLEVRNVEEITGPDCFYRLRASVVQPDFALSIATDRLAVPAGGTVAIPITVERIGGFAGPVEVKIEDLPAGILCSGGVMPGNKSSIEVTLTAAPNALVAAMQARVRGDAEIGGKTVTREAPAWEKYEHRSIDLLLSVEYTYTRPFHLWDMLICAVTDRVDPVTVSAAAESYDLAPGGKIEIPVHIERQPDAKGEVKIELRNLPAKVSATSPPIPAGQSEGKITLTAAPDAPADLVNVILTAKHGNAASLAPAIRVTVKK